LANLLHSTTIVSVMSNKDEKLVKRPRTKSQREQIRVRTQDETIGVQAFERGLDVIRAFATEQRPLTLSEIASITGQPRATTRRLLGSLLRLNYASTDGQTYKLLPAILEIGFAYLLTNDIWERVQPYIEEVMLILNESSSMGVLDLPYVVYVARASARRIVQNIAINVGSKVPATVSAMGRILLAHQPRSFLEEYLQRNPLEQYTEKTIIDTRAFFTELDKARECNWILVDEEFEIGLRSIAVPLRDRNGEVIAAMNVGAPSSRVTAQQMISEFLPVIVAAANKANHVLSLGVASSSAHTP